jgi:hypothetical protein
MHYPSSWPTQIQQTQKSTNDGARFAPAVLPRLYGLYAEPGEKTHHAPYVHHAEVLDKGPAWVQTSEGQEGTEDVEGSEERGARDKVNVEEELRMKRGAQD